MRLLVDHLRRQWRPLAGVFVLATINQLLLLTEPHIVRLIVDRWVMRLESVPWPVFFRGVGLLVLAGVVIALLARVARIYQDYGANLIAQRVGTALYARSVAQSLLLPFNVFEDQRSGELLQKIQKARLDAQTGLTHLVRLYLAGLALVAVTIYAFVVHPFLGIVFLTLIPLLAAAVFAISRPIRRQQKIIARESAALAGTTTEAIRNVELVKSLGIHEQEIARLDAANERLLSLEERKLRLVRLFAFGEGTIMNTGRAALLLMMLWLVYSRAITVGEFLTFLLYSQWLFAPLTELGAAVSRYQEARATFETLDDVLDVPQQNDHDHVPVGTIEQVCLEAVTLDHGASHSPALDHVDLLFLAGETVALAGPSGSGKSSVVKLITGLYQPASGAVRINGIDARAIDITEFRSRIGLVTQETYLFAGTIRENLTLVRPDATDEQCLDALAKAGATPIIERGGAMLDTRIGEGGLKLSGGERQRIAIARALLREPELLIFDEATSNLDPISERAVTATIRAIATSSAARITIIVAHRLSTVAHADRIIVLSDGKIVESGSHQSLLAQAGLYARMHDQQSFPAADAT